MADAAESTGSSNHPEATVRVPGLLARYTDGQPCVAVRAGSVAGAVNRLLEAYPALEPHLLDAGGLRPHLKLFLNGTEVDDRAADEVVLADGDEVVVLQAVSGG